MPDLDPRLSIQDVMTRAAITARPDTSIDTLIDLMTEHHIGCIPIVDDHGRPTGIVTKLDLIECRRDARPTAREVMMPHAMTLGPTATIAQAAARMSNEGFHHLLVVDADRKLLGVVSTLDLVRWIAGNSAPLDRPDPAYIARMH